MAGRLVCNNFFLKRSLQRDVDQLNAGKFLILFANNIAITPATSQASLNQPFVIGYAPLSMTACWGVPVKNFDGVYSSTTIRFTFSSPEHIGTTIYGFAVIGGGDISLAGNFASPFLWRSGNPLSLTLTLRGGDLTVSCA